MNAHLLAAVACASLSIANIGVWAQGYPAKPVRLIVPFPAGGGSDIVGRIMSHKLSDLMKQQVFVENRAGAGGSIGTEAAVRSAPDGYTMVLASTSEIAVNPALYTKLAYDTVRDLAAVAMVASTPMVVVVHPSLPVRTVRDLVALAKARPGDINLASAGNGTFTHLSGELFRSVANIQWTHVPYKGAPPALTDLASGQVQVMFSSLPAAVGLIKGGRLKAVAVSTVKRSEALPEVPTVRESGVPGYDVEYWYGVFVPAATSRETVGHLHEAVAQALRSQDVIGNLGKQGATPSALSQSQFADLVKSEVTKWGKVARATGVKLD
ncbi:MAG: tripartite tricarboxylate transporter substrate binding protein [Betaproteobacteria bacterium]|nr:tripartite tricarboxylate transporter substrate binding protein [Betaproteobacteria bacterium]